MKRGFKMLDVEAKSIRFVYRVRERDVEGEREREVGGSSFIGRRCGYMVSACQAFPSQTIPANQRCSIDQPWNRLTNRRPLMPD